MENQSITDQQTDTRAELLAVFEETADNLLSTITWFNEQQFNIALFADSWTAGQVAEHVYKSASGLIPVLNGDTQPVERGPAEKVQMIKDLFLDFEAKYKSAPGILPSVGPHYKAEVIAMLNTAIPQVKEVIKSKNLYTICPEPKVPGLGELTRLEWLYLICYHTQRHIHQLKTIGQAL